MSPGDAGATGGGTCSENWSFRWGGASTGTFNLSLGRGYEETCLYIGQNVTPFLCLNFLKVDSVVPWDFHSFQALFQHICRLCQMTSDHMCLCETLDREHAAAWLEGVLESDRPGFGSCSALS